MGFLAVHGFLHLNGYDHMEPEDEKEMFGLQKEILDAYGLKDEQTGKNKHFINSLEFARKESKQFFEKNVICANMWRLRHGHCVWFLVFLNTC